jgi:hypothetical protein
VVRVVGMRAPVLWGWLVGTADALPGLFLPLEQPQVLNVDDGLPDVERVVVDQLRLARAR